MKGEKRHASMYVAQNTYYAENNREVFMGPGCSAGSCKLCTKAITCRNDRLLVFWTYRTLARGEEKYKFLRDLMKVEPIQTAGQKPRKRRIRYHLPVEEALVQVCRKMFLHTMAISSRQIFRVLRQGGGGKGSKIRKLSGGKGKIAALKAATLGHKQAETGDGSSVRRKHSKEKENGWEGAEYLSRVKSINKEEHLSSGGSVSASQSDLISPRLGVGSSGGAGPLLEIRPNAQGPGGDGGGGLEYNKSLIEGSDGKCVIERERNSQAGKDEDKVLLPSWVISGGGSRTKRKEVGIVAEAVKTKKIITMVNINKGPNKGGKQSNGTTAEGPESGSSDGRDTSMAKLVLKKDESEIEHESRNGWRAIGDAEGGKYNSSTDAQQMCDLESKDLCLSDDDKRYGKDLCQLKDSPKWKGGGDPLGEGGSLHGDLGDEGDPDWVEDDEEEELGLRLEEDDEEEEEGEF